VFEQCSYRRREGDRVVSWKFPYVGMNLASKAMGHPGQRGQGARTRCASGWAGLRSGKLMAHFGRITARREDAYETNRFSLRGGRLL
jgi:hypothetical protein